MVLDAEFYVWKGECAVWCVFFSSLWPSPFSKAAALVGGESKHVSWLGFYLEHLGTLDGRVGFTPTPNSLLLATAGLAFSDAGSNGAALLTSKGDA